MPNITQPRNYRSRITPYSQRLLQFGIDDSKVYLSKASNSLLETLTLGYDSTQYPIDLDHPQDIISVNYLDRKECILDGLKTEVSIDGNDAVVVVKCGNLICDNVLLTFPEDTTLNLDLTDYDDDGCLILSVQFQYLDTPYENAPRLRLSYLSADKTIVYPVNWISNIDRMVITKISFTKDASNVLVNLINHMPKPFDVIDRQFIVINTAPYEIAPLPNMFYNFIKSIQAHFSRKLVFNIEGILDNYITDVPPFEGSGQYFYTPLPIGTLETMDVNVQCYINNVKIEPAGIQHVSNTEVRIWFPAFFIDQPTIPNIKVIVIG